ncbi:c-type cytochrome [Paraburkholderia sp. HD33-4]|uniref:c-type cytochrome n=1 Tax=Paraburkholderia sp. HD33-4 TaxID=2883242 RepID=UPI001F2E9C2A|nr:cytochrome c [Paraburkholderia sp. HD33-4]
MIIAIGIAAVAGVLFVAAGETPRRANATANANAQTPGVPPDREQTVLIAKGEYLAKAADCAGCHTAPPGGASGKEPLHPSAPLAGGLAINSPFGTIWSSNITPDPVGGIGRYSYDDFQRAVRDGVAPGNRRLYPAMPYPSFAKISDDDMHALYAYFMHGVAPVAQVPPHTALPFPFNQRWALGLWSLTFAPDHRFVPESGRSAQWNRGAYLVQSLGHCGACHTPRGPAYEERGYSEHSRLYLTGGENDHWFAPNLSADNASGLGRLSEDEIAAFLKRGHGGGLVTFGSMVQVVEDSTQYLSDDDLQAIARYLKSLPAREPSGHYGDGRTATQMVRAIASGEIELPGAGIYWGFCARCHHADGSGEAFRYPRIAGNPAVLSANTDSLVRLLVEGGEAPLTESGPQPKKMPSFAGDLTDAEMAHVLTFVRNAWGNTAAPVTTRDVASVRRSLGK